VTREHELVFYELVFNEYPASIAANVYAVIDAIDEVGLDGTAKVNGSQEAVNEVFNSFDKVSKETVAPAQLDN
jgi:hypothetical protein